jgi:Enolase, C-terminal TIM barrel domain
MNHHHSTAGQHSASDTPRYAYPIGVGVGDRASPSVRTTQPNRQLSKRFQARPSLTARTAAGGPVVDSSDEKSGIYWCGFILKPNQVGTIAEALDCFEYASQNAILAIPSGRSGGVIDDVVMDLAVGLGAPFQKSGAPRSGERIEKLNFLLRAAEPIPNCALADVPALVRF